MTATHKKTIIYTRESLRLEQYRLKLAIKEQEAALRQRVQKFPGELLYAGADAILPAALTGKISNRILTAGKNFINSAIVKKTGGHTSRLVTIVKQVGLFALFKTVYRGVIKRK
jgi:hypothetical protein